MLIDVWKQFNGLLPSQAVTFATVTALNGDGTSTVTTPEGGILRAQGATVAAGLHVYVQDGRIVGVAPDLPAYDLTV